jgi:hypothetical protein
MLRGLASAIFVAHGRIPVRDRLPGWAVGRAPGFCTSCAKSGLGLPLPFGIGFGVGFVVVHRYGAGAPSTGASVGFNSTLTGLMPSITIGPE